MTRSTVLIGVFTASLGLTATPVLAQRSASSGESTGASAVSRGGDGGSSGGSSSSGSSSGVYSAPSSGTYSAPPSRDYGTPAPSRNAEAQGRSRGGREGSDSGRAVPRGSSGSGGSTTRTSGATASGDRSDRAVPSSSRSRGNRAATGEATERTGTGIGGGPFPRIGDYRTRYFFPGSLYSRYYFPGYGFGLGYFYDPFWYDPFYYGFGPGYGSGYGYPYGGYGGGYGGSYGSGGGSYSALETGGLRLKIKPQDAQVYVDGYYVGTVDDFDGVFQKLKIEAGGHRIEIRADGYEVASFDVLITPGETVTYEGDLEAR